MIGLFAYDSRCVAGNERMLQTLVHECDAVCERKKLKVAVGKRKIITLGSTGE